METNETLNDELEQLRNRHLRTDAEEHLAGVLQSMTAGEIADGSFTYDDETGRAEKFMVAGGGPSAYAVFVEFARDDVTGYLEFADVTGTTIVYIPDRFVFKLRSLLRADAKARNAR